MSTRSSPTARLLRSSRLFSLPRPLPAPSLEPPSSTGTYRASETATLYHPTHQAIATPASSHHRGDWGLKRPLPGKVVKRSDAVIKVLGQDTSDHITEFESSAGEVRGLRKWGEMGVHFTATAGGRQEVGAPKLSVYEDFLDATDPDAPARVPSGQGKNLSFEKRRWKNQGPWIAGMSEGEFVKWLDKAIAGRKEEWETFLTNNLAEKEFERMRREAREAGTWFGPLESASPVVRAGLVVEEAEREARRLIVGAADSQESEEKSLAGERGEDLVRKARDERERYEIEARKWQAPGEAERIMKEARAQAFTEGKKSFEKLAKRMEALLKRLQQQAAEQDFDAVADETERLVQKVKQDEKAYAAEVKNTQAPDEAFCSVLEARKQALSDEAGNFEATQVLQDSIDAALSTTRPELASILDSASTEAARVLELENVGDVTHTTIWSHIAAAHSSLRAEQDRRAALQRAWETALLGSLRPSKSALPSILKSLRASHATDVLSSDLTSLLTRFFDLPSLHTPSSLLGNSQDNPNSRWLTALTTDFNLGATDSAPPTTHPAAGLSYLRTNAIMENHPVHGPQATRSPISARILATRNSAKGRQIQNALLGVGGFVATDSKSAEYKSSTRPNAVVTDVDPAANLDERTIGGAKMWVHPTSATVDAAGRIKLNVVRAEREAVAVRTDTTEEILRERMAPAKFGSGNTLLPGSIGDGWFGNRKNVGVKANYGAGLPDLRRMEADRVKFGSGRRDAGRSGERRGGFKGAEGFGEGDEALRRIEELAGISRNSEGTRGG